MFDNQVKDERKSSNPSKANYTVKKSPGIKQTRKVYREASGPVKKAPKLRARVNLPDSNLNAYKSKMEARTEEKTKQSYSLSGGQRITNNKPEKSVAEFNRKKAKTRKSVIPERNDAPDRTITREIPLSEMGSAEKPVKRPKTISGDTNIKASEKRPNLRESKPVKKVSENNIDVKSKSNLKSAETTRPRQHIRTDIDNVKTDIQNNPDNNMKPKKEVTERKTVTRKAKKEIPKKIENGR